MTKTEAAPALEELLQFFKALADESRLKIIGILATEKRSVEEIATLLRLKAPTVSHHLAKLREAGIVRMEPAGNVHYYTLNESALHEWVKRILPAKAMAGWVKELDASAWERKVIHDFLEGDRLKTIPASRKKREVILRWLADQFEPGRTYTEKEVNETIDRYHEDFATLRRELIMAKLLERRPDQGLYWRV